LFNLFNTYNRLNQFNAMQEKILLDNIEIS